MHEPHKNSRECYECVMKVEKVVYQIYNTTSMTEGAQVLRDD
jgi:hypothetical protein